MWKRSAKTSWCWGGAGLLAQGRIDALKQPHDRQFEVRVKGDPLAFAGRLAARGIAAVPSDDHLLVQLPEGTSPAVLWETAGETGEQLRALRPRRSTLEEIFLAPWRKKTDADSRPGISALERPAYGPCLALADDYPARCSRPAQESLGLAPAPGACLPAFILSGFLVLWGLFEQKSSLLTPLLFLFQGLPEELRAGPRGYRTTFWTLAFNQFLDVQLFFAMGLVLLVGPELISQDLRFNAMPLYLRDRSGGSTTSRENSVSSLPILAPSWSCRSCWRSASGSPSALIPWCFAIPGACWRPRSPTVRWSCYQRAH